MLRMLKVACGSQTRASPSPLKQRNGCLLRGAPKEQDINVVPGQACPQADHLLYVLCDKHPGSAHAPLDKDSHAHSTDTYTLPSPAHQL